mmetsp:Transcript_630/g.1112  ORF Transcript_630/g.1112 Transcript_630/m.1112 type:complete len:706 (-) Transcript_630:1265-3382(-)
MSSVVDQKRSIIEKERRNKALERLIEFCKPEALKISLGFTALIVNSITNLSFPWMMGKSLDQISPENFGQYVIGSAAVFLFGSAASWIRIYCLGTATDSICARLRQALFESYLDKDLEYFDSTQTGELLAVLDDDVNTAAEALTEKLASGLRSCNSAVNGSILLYMTSPRLCAVSMSIVPLVGVGGMVLSKRASALAKEKRSLQSEVLSYTLERINGIATVKLNEREGFERMKFRSLMRENESSSQKWYKARGFFMAFVNLSTNVSLVAVLREGGKLLAGGTMTAGKLARFAMQSAFVGLGFSGLATFYSDMMNSLEAAARVFEIIDQNRDVGASSNRVAAEAESTGTVGQLSESSSLASLADADSVFAALDEAVSAAAAATDADMELQNVRFAYGSRCTTPVLRDLNVRISPRSLTCIVGTSGCGKSTLVAVLGGLLFPQQGSIKVGNTVIVSSEDQGDQFGSISNSSEQALVGSPYVLPTVVTTGYVSANVSACSLSEKTAQSTGTVRTTGTGGSSATSSSRAAGVRWLRRHVGVVQQRDQSLFSGTIRENIEYGYRSTGSSSSSSSSSRGMGASLQVNANELPQSRMASSQQIEAAARAASAHEFIMALPDGYDSSVGEGGSLLSGGQRARIALARALIKDPDWLLLDEPTAALDAVNEQEVLTALLELRKRKTVIIITHSEAVQRVADVVYEMAEGRIVEA